MIKGIAHNRSTLYRMALKHFGPESQALKLIEEAAELGAAASRNLNGLGNEVALAEEMADVEIMIEQFRLNGMDKLIELAKHNKLKRLAERLEVEYAPYETSSQTEALAYTRGYQDRCDELSKVVGEKDNE